MKSIKRKVSNIKISNQSTPLLESGKDQNQENKKKSSTSRSRYSSQGSIPDDANANYSESPSPQRKRSPYSPDSAIFETAFQPPPKQEPSWVKEAREQSAKEPVVDHEESSFKLIEISIDDTWYSTIWQSVLLVLSFVVLPSILFALLGVIFIRCVIAPNVGRRSASGKRKLRVALIALIAAIIFSIFKDNIIATSIVCSIFEVTISFYEIIYANLLLFSLLLFVALPLIIYVYSEAQFSYGSEIGDTNGKSKIIKGRKLASDFMKKHLYSLHEVNKPKEQAIMLWKFASKWLSVVMAVTAFVICLVRSFTPWLFRFYHPQQQSLGYVNFTQNSNNTNNATSFVNITAPGTNKTMVNDVVLVLSAANALIMSISLFFVFIVAVQWHLLMLRMWWGFNSSTAAGNDLLGSGNDGIIAWWRIYQTLRFHTWSKGNPPGIIRLFLHSLFTIAVITVSCYLLLNQGSFTGVCKVTAYLAVTDNLLLVTGLVIDMIISALIRASQRALMETVSLERLNMAQQVGKCIGSGGGSSPGKVEGEYQVHLKRFKNRNLRASFQLLQEMHLVLKEMESHTTNLFYTLLCLVVVAVGIVSSAKTLNGLS
eukprot:Seg378.28 transcript_id=Seg378.28/GoldUCD/mRNA.D3Y31 product="hypothetical protein" protein_id=Seg378.28/GoldUCD/D3Y31